MHGDARGYAQRSAGWIRRQAGCAGSWAGAVRPRLAIEHAQGLFALREAGLRAVELGLQLGVGLVVHYMVHCMVHYMVHCMVHYTVHPIASTCSSGAILCSTVEYSRLALTHAARGAAATDTR